jgi:ABC-2 type transport system ATP-binding protein
MEEADRLSDRVAIIDLGRIVALDTPANLKAAAERADATLEDVFLEMTGRSLHR